MRIRRSCPLVGGLILLYRNIIQVGITLAVLAVVSGVLALAKPSNSVAEGGKSTATTDTSTTATTTTEPALTEQVSTILLQKANRGIVRAIHETWHWQRLMGRKTTLSHYRTTEPHSLQYAQWVLNLWQQRAKHWQSAARRWMRQRIPVYRRDVRIWRLVMGKVAPHRALAAHGGLEERFRRWHRTEQKVHYQWVHPPYMSAWLCIHHYEGSWTDPDSPYWGGLQMDLTFQQTYGPWLLKHKGTADHWTAFEQIWTALKSYWSRGFEPWHNTARACGLL